MSRTVGILSALAAILAAVLIVRGVDRPATAAGHRSEAPPPQGVVSRAAAVGPAAAAPESASLAEPGACAVRGRVVDRGGIPVNHASVRVALHVPYDQPNYVATDTFDARPALGNDGRFAIAVPKHGKFFISAEADGFASASVDWVNPGDEVELVVDVPGRVAGKVVHRGTGASLAGAKLWLHVDSHPLGPLRETVSGADGSYAFEGLPAGELRVWTWIEGFSGQWDTLALEPGGRTERDIRLDPGLRISGRVVEAGTGRPISRAQVGCPEHLVPTDAAGAFVLGGLGRGLYAIGAWAKGYLPGSLTVTVDAGRTPDDLEFVMEPVPIVHGVVTDEQGRPIAGARVSSWQEDVESGQDGAFAVSAGFQQADRPRIISAAKKGLTTGQAVAGEPSAKLTIRLEPADAKLTGRVTGEDGAPVAGARVTCRDNAEIRVAGTDESGGFAFEGLQRDAVVRIDVTAQGYLSCSGSSQPSAGAPGVVELVLRKEVSVESAIVGTVAGEDGRGIGGAHIRGVGSTDLRFKPATSSHDGRFTLTSIGLQPLGVTIQASAAGFAPGWAQVDATNPAPVSLTLQRLGSVRGRVVDGDTGEAVRHVTVFATVENYPWVGRTGDSSEFQFDVAPGTFNLRVDCERYRSIEERSGEVLPGQICDVGTITMWKGAVIEGVILPAPGVSMHRIGVAVRKSRSEPWAWVGWTDSTGWYRLDELEERVFEVMGVDDATPAWGASWRPIITSPIGTVRTTRASPARLDGRMEAAATLHVTLRAPSEDGSEPARTAPGFVPRPTAEANESDTKLLLSITALDGAPLFWIGDSVRPELVAVWDAKGIDMGFPVATLHAGTYRLTFTGDGRAPVEKTVQLAAAQEARVTLELPAPSRPPR